jgi:hypothetical protein
MSAQAAPAAGPRGKVFGTLDDAPDFVNLLLYGEPGSGKTSHLASMAVLGKLYLLNVEGGAKAKPLRRLGIPTANIVPVQIESYRDLDEFYWWFKAALADDKDGEIAGCGIDSISEIHDMLIREQADVRHSKAANKARLSGQELEDNEFQIELPERGIVTEQLRLLSRRFRDLPCHTVWTALVKSEIDQQGSGGKVLIPALPPKFSNNLRGYVDVVGYTTLAEGVEGPSGYLGVFRETGMYRGKDRLGGIPPVLALPTFERIRKIVLDDYDLSQDAVQQQYAARVQARLPAPPPEQAAQSEGVQAAA